VAGISSPWTNPFAALWRWISAPLDEVLADAAREGETLVARIRIWLTLLILTIPLLSLAAGPVGVQHWVGLGIAGGAVVLAVVLEVVVRRGRHAKWLSVVTTLSDVTLISLGLFTFWAIGMPIVTANSRVIFEAYFIAIAASALRYSPAICVVAGVGAVTQYLLLSLLVAVGTTPASRAVLADAYGSFDWTTQVSRVVMLLGMTVMALAVVNRTSRLRRLSTFDRLTGLFNRAYVEEYLGHELARAVRESQPFTVAMLDVDHFKLFNDSHGHAAGDAALRQLADTLRSELRRSDVVARFGGEEILVAMPATQLRAAMEKLDEVRIKVGLTDIPLPRGGIARVTVSMGVATLSVDGPELDVLLDAADARMYAAKEAGRNRVYGPADVGATPPP
jgi:diguanylate cyclase (GGDEF)-like protein